LVALGGTFKSEETPQTPLAPVVTPQPSLQTVPASAPAVNAPSIEVPLNSPLAVQSPSIGLAPADTVLLPRAGFWKRLLALLLDLVLIGLIVPLVGKWFILFGIAYFVAMWTWKGTTIGSIVLGLKLVRTDGQPVNFAVALVRSLSALFSAVVFFLGFLWAGWDRDKQAWHDKIAGTVVVRMPRDFALI